MTVIEAVNAMLAEADCPLTEPQKEVVRTLVVAAIGSLERIATALEAIERRGRPQ